MPKRHTTEQVIQWDGETTSSMVDEIGNEVKQTILSEIAAGVNYSVELLDSKVHTSLVWRYFGVLLREGTPFKPEVSSNYCSICLQSGLLFRYSKATANGNLLRHLKCAHHLELETRRRKEPKSDNSSKRLKTKMPRKPKKQIETRDTKFHIAREIAYWLTIDLRPFSWLPNNGLQHFLKQFGVVNEDFEMPSSTVIYREALEEAYDLVELRVKQLLADHEIAYNLSVECYTDNYKQVQYFSCTIHWIDDSWNLNQINLGTVFVDVVDSSAEAFFKIIVEKLKEFGIEKILFAVCDQEQKLLDAFTLLALERLPCAAGTMTELINRDLLLADIDILRLIQEPAIKLRQIYKEVAFKLDTLEKTWRELQKSTELFKDFMESSSKLDAMLEAEQRVSCGPDSAISAHNWITTWYICDHFLKFADVLGEVSFKDPLTEDDYKYGTFLRDILGDLLPSTDILNAAKFSSLSSYLLFRSELVDKIDKIKPESENKDDISMLKNTVYQQLYTGVIARFVVNEASVCSAIVDPATKDLEVIDQFLTVVTSNKHELVKGLLSKHELLTKVEDAKSRAFSEDEAAVQKEDSKDGQRHKKLRLQLLTKHSNTEALSSLDVEIKKYLLVSDALDDPLSWWKANGDAFPYIQRLAKLYLSIPATVCPFERAFSTIGLVATGNRCGLCPTLMKKMLFIHDNFEAVMDR